MADLTAVATLGYVTSDASAVKEQAVATLGYYVLAVAVSDYAGPLRLRAGAMTARFDAASQTARFHGAAMPPRFRGSSH